MGGVCEKTDIFAPSSGELALNCEELRSHGVQTEYYDLNSGDGHYSIISQFQRVFGIISEFIEKNLSDLNLSTRDKSAGFKIGA